MTWFYKSTFASTICLCPLLVTGLDTRLMSQILHVNFHTKVLKWYFFRCVNCLDTTSDTFWQVEKANLRVRGSQVTGVGRQLQPHSLMMEPIDCWIVAVHVLSYFSTAVGFSPSCFVQQWERPLAGLPLGWSLLKMANSDGNGPKFIDPLKNGKDGKPVNP